MKETEFSKQVDRIRTNTKPSGSAESSEECLLRGIIESILLLAEVTNERTEVAQYEWNYRVNHRSGI